MSKVVKLSSLKKTWIIDLDGTVVRHNGYKTNGVDTFLPGALEFLKNLPPDDMIIFITSRHQEYAENTESFLNKYEIRYDTILYNAPYGERILINDKKPSGLITAIAINTKRDVFMSVKFEEDNNL
jgi:ribonucleotide monophosphatase NagD (HAD superfamily)